MNIHMMMRGKFADRFVDFIRNNYLPTQDHVFVYEGRENANDEYVTYTLDLIHDIDLTSLGADGKLFVHGFYLPEFVDFVLKQRKYITEKRLVLIIHGAELYNNRLLLAENIFHPGIWIQEIKKRRLIKMSQQFMTFASPDFELICRWYGAKGKQFDCLYPTNANVDKLDWMLHNREENDVTRVLLGNSATITNKHREALDWLSQYKHCEMEIVCPLSYGDMNYARKVSEYGRSIFGDKFIPVLDFLDIDAYTSLLNSVDIAIFNNNRQQATGNIEILGYLGKKVFVRSDTTMWGHYVMRDTCRFFDTLTIPNMSFDEFVSITRQDIEHNRAYFGEIWSNEFIKRLWDTVMEF